MCRQVIESDDAWLRENWAALQKLQCSPEVRLFLIKQEGASLLALMHETAEAPEPEVRNAAWEPLSARNLSQELLEPVVGAFKAMHDVDQRFEFLGRNGLAGADPALGGLRCPEGTSFR
jgi:hypothetical protein